jgi:hypothetical protein
MNLSMSFDSASWLRVIQSFPTVPVLSTMICLYQSRPRVDAFTSDGGGVVSGDVQCEAISLTRDVPVGLGPLIAPFIRSIPKQSLEFTLRATRTAFAPKVTAPGSKTGGQP